MKKLLLLFLLHLTLTDSIAQSVGDRVALVIGNGAYKSVASLQNPVNDAKAISGKLSKLGFTVTTLEDASLGQVKEALGVFEKKSRVADIALLFYAGHAFMTDGKAYMMPIDASFANPASIKKTSLSLNDILKDYLHSKNKIIVYDASLDNPFDNKDLTLIYEPSFRDALIFFSTEPGSYALDAGAGQKNSPFTEALLAHLSDPEDITVVLRRVREQVLKDTNGKQRPWEYGSLTGGALVLSDIKPKR